MSNFLFYTATVLIWGSTWLAIKFQLGSVDPLASVAYRFALAALLLLGFCLLSRRRMRFSLREHLFIALQGGLLFAINYWMFYLAELYLASGLVAVVFSTMVILNVVNGALLLGTPIEARVIVGGALGLFGIGLVFWPELRAFDFSGQGVQGLLLCLLATLMASLGNIVSARNQRHGLPIVQTNAYGMSYGALLSFAYVLVSGREFGFELSGAYLGSLLYLAVFGSIVAFGCYLTLVGRIGAGRAAYTTLLFPLVALGLSTLFENYHWSLSAVAGILLILAGNVLALKKPRRRAAVPTPEAPDLQPSTLSETEHPCRTTA
ncbi:membrane protein [Desulfuromonas versatilis]|uniref:Membrane protein n=1 Tax=Desulfuromonas versatilis TaxID=2802975 RepID=A0ABN6DU71_9BACT|nr:DMT family transporter [Desulfuromonas versatilis]BCR03657.1 membrane protein [Desulfuromonas versatilis]